MSLFAISDLHLSFADAVDKPMDVFGEEWVDHEAKISAACGDLVSDEDVLLIPGDISWGIDLQQAAPDLEYVSKLPGKKLLLRGNHDYWWTSMKKMRGLYPDIDFIQNDAHEFDGFVICGTRGWYLPWNPGKGHTPEENKKIYERELLRLEMSLQAATEKLNGRKLVAATHFPPLDADHKGTQVTELYQKYGVDIALYGHLHGRHWAEAAEGVIGGIEYRLVSQDKLHSIPMKVL